jgi:hypothetical protein
MAAGENCLRSGALFSAGFQLVDSRLWLAFKAAVHSKMTTPTRTTTHGPRYAPKVAAWSTFRRTLHMTLWVLCRGHGISGLPVLDEAKVGDTSRTKYRTPVGPSAALPLVRSAIHCFDKMQQQDLSNMS